MASLKDMRVRIASTKATQKITKAMQMVAASKLRRAQAAAEAARPYAERMEKVLGNIAADGHRHQFGAEASGRHRRRSGASAGGLHRRARPVRRVQLVDRPARAREDQRADRGRQDRENPLRRPQGRRPASPPIRLADHRGDRAAREDAGLRARRAGQPEDHRALRGRPVRRRHAVLLALQVGDLADPDGAADHPAGVRGRGRKRAVGGLRIRAGRTRHSDRAVAAQHHGAGVPRASWKTPRPSRARACRRWTTPRATPAK